MRELERRHDSGGIINVMAVWQIRPSAWEMERSARWDVVSVYAGASADASNRMFSVIGHDTRYRLTRNNDAITTRVRHKETGEEMRLEYTADTGVLYLVNGYYHPRLHLPVARVNRQLIRRKTIFGYLQYVYTAQIAAGVDVAFVAAFMMAVQEHLRAQ